MTEAPGYFCNRDWYLVDENSTWFWPFFLTESVKRINFATCLRTWSLDLNPKSVNEIFGIKSNIFYTFFVTNLNVYQRGAQTYNVKIKEKCRGRLWGIDFGSWKFWQSYSTKSNHANGKRELYLKFCEGFLYVFNRTIQIFRRQTFYFINFFSDQCSAHNWAAEEKAELNSEKLVVIDNSALLLRATFCCFWWRR